MCLYILYIYIHKSALKIITCSKFFIIVTGEQYKRSVTSRHLNHLFSLTNSILTQEKVQKGPNKKIISITDPLACLSII